MADLDNALSTIDKNIDAALERLFALLRIPSISTDPAYKAYCAQTGQYLTDMLNDLGFDASLRKTPGHPIVVAHHQGPSDRNKKVPHVLFYGHYDVQPVDPLEEWHSDPFEPVIREKDGRKQIFCRGAADDKGQIMTFVEACRGWIESSGELPCRVTVMLEGEEESASPSLPAFLKETAEELSCDLALICDTNMWDVKTPAIALSLRGMVGEKFTIEAANRDLHSGYYGGPSKNPIHILSKIITDLHDENGKVTLDGFYDGVEEVPDEILQKWQGLNFSETAFLNEIGLSEAAGEKDRSVLEKIWARPTAEVNGMWGGYTGEGFKTVIPSQVSAKISFRMVSKQDPIKIGKTFRQFVEERLPEDCSVHFDAHCYNPALQVDYKLPELQKASAALSEEWGVKTAIIGSGGSIPVVRQLSEKLGMNSLMIGFGLDDDAIHSPNEKYEMSSFVKGTRSWARILAALAE